MPLIDSRTTRVLFTVFLFALGFGFLLRRPPDDHSLSFPPFFSPIWWSPLSPKHLRKLDQKQAIGIAVIYLLILIFLGTFFFSSGAEDRP